MINESSWLAPWTWSWKPTSEIHLKVAEIRMLEGNFKQILCTQISLNSPDNILQIMQLPLLTFVQGLRIPIQQSSVKVGNAEINTIIVGNGPPLVLLHGKKYTFR
jgi:hypothetical protein